MLLPWDTPLTKIYWFIILKLLIFIVFLPNYAGDPPKSPVGFPNFIAGTIEI